MNVTSAQIPANRDLDLQNAKLAFTIINALVSHNETLSDLIALMAQALDEDTQHALTNTAPWQNYLDSRRGLENTRRQIEKFTEELQKLENSET